VKEIPEFSLYRESYLCRMNEEVEKIVGTTLDGFQWGIAAAAVVLLIYFILKKAVKKKKP
jgi:hypothetical protein